MPGDDDEDRVLEAAARRDAAAEIDHEALVA
jgi:hypothetical protein